MDMKTGELDRRKLFCFVFIDPILISVGLTSLLRCGKSCRLRWINYLRPDVKRGNFSKEEEEKIIRLHETLGNKWSKIASQLVGRTDNEIKNVWNTYLKKRLVPKNDESKESCMTSSSCSSSNSNISNSSQVDGSNPHVGPLFDVIGVYGTNNTSEEVNKPEISDTAFDIPLESDSEFWDMLDSFGSFQPDEIQSNSGVDYSEEGENNQWFRYLEIELGLDVTRNENPAEPLVDMLLEP